MVEAFFIIIASAVILTGISLFRGDAIKPIRGTVFLYFAILVSLVLLFMAFKENYRVFDYKIIEASSIGTEYEDGKLNLPKVDIEELGAGGWELVGVVDDIRTSFPNFGDMEYHTGMKSNTHTKGAYLIFKRPRYRWIKANS